MNLTKSVFIAILILKQLWIYMQLINGALSPKIDNFKLRAFLDALDVL